MSGIRLVAWIPKMKNYLCDKIHPKTYFRKPEILRDFAILSGKNLFF
jgi:hypothetical protein